jgi:hypothetical protein
MIGVCCLHFAAGGGSGATPSSDASACFAINAIKTRS